MENGIGMPMMMMADGKRGGSASCLLVEYWIAIYYKTHCIGVRENRAFRNLVRYQSELRIPNALEWRETTRFQLHAQRSSCYDTNCLVATKNNMEATGVVKR